MTEISASLCGRCRDKPWTQSQQPTTSRSGRPYPRSRRTPSQLCDERSGHIRRLTDTQSSWGKRLDLEHMVLYGNVYWSGKPYKNRISPGTHRETDTEDPHRLTGTNHSATIYCSSPICNFSSAGNITAHCYYCTHPHPDRHLQAAADHAK